MTAAQMFLRVAEDEAHTLHEYQLMLNEIIDFDEGAKAVMDEIIGDEFNHCLIALLSAKNALGIDIATDDMPPDPNDIEVP